MLHQQSDAARSHSATIISSQSFTLASYVLQTQLKITDDRGRTIAYAGVQWGTAPASWLLKILCSFLAGQSLFRKLARADQQVNNKC